MKKHGERTKDTRREHEDELLDLPSEPDETELEHRQAEALATWRDNPSVRVDMVKRMGQSEHEVWQEEVRRAEATGGRNERSGDGAGDFGIEFSLAHPDGRQVRYDYVDFETHQIVDRKPIASDETVIDVAQRYEAQRRRHIEAYRNKFGVEPEYHYSFYPSASELDKLPA